MGCGNCGTSTNGKPGGCKSNGNCTTGGCNRLNVFDWLSELPLNEGEKAFPVMEISFNKGSRKDYVRNANNFYYKKGDWIAVEGVNGFDVGRVSLTGELVKMQLKKYNITEPINELKRSLRIATEEDLDLSEKNKLKEAEILIESRAIARTLKLDMKIAEVEIQADGKKATFFYTANARVDFRELIRSYSTTFNLRVEMRQIGARQESGKIGGIGSCGRELCCSTWLTDFKNVNTNMARYQNLSINQVKLSGQCGRLKCCLNYELDTYMDLLKQFPNNADKIETQQGITFLQKKDIFKDLMWYSYKGSNKQYPLTIERVKEIVELNNTGIKPDEMGAVEIEISQPKVAAKIDAGFVNDVGQITLKALEKRGKNKSKNKSKDLQSKPNPNNRSNNTAAPVTLKNNAPNLQNNASVQPNLNKNKRNNKNRNTANSQNKEMPKKE